MECACWGGKKVKGQEVAEQDLREGKQALNKKIKLNNNGKEKAGKF